MVSAIGIIVVLLILWDAFETVVLPRRVTRRLRITGIYYRTLRKVWSATARRITNAVGVSRI